VLGPGQLLLAAVDRHQRTVDQGRDVAARPGGQLHGGALVGAGLQRRQLEPGGFQEDEPAARAAYGGNLSLSLWLLLED
jgi:hypothetical protein